MAFGKDPEQKKNIVGYGGSYAQRAAQAGRREKRERGSGGRPYWVDNYRPNDQVPDTIRLLPGSYQIQRDGGNGMVITEELPWFECVEHYHGGLKKGGLCSAGPLRGLKNKRDACHGCDIFWEDYGIREAKKRETGEKVQNPNRMSMSDKFVFEVLDLGTFYKADQVDDRGNVRRNNNGEPFWDWKKLLYPNDPNAIGKETKLGHVMSWAMGRRHFNALNGYGDHIANSCSGCGSRGDSLTPILQTIMYQCGNPDCGAPLIRLDQTTMSPQQVQELVRSPFKCQHCQHVLFLQEVLHCQICQQKGTMPQRAWAFDVDMQVKLQRDPNDANQTQLLVLAYSEPRPIASAYDDALKHRINLADRFKPTTLAEQEALWNISASAAPAQPHAQTY